MFEALSRWFHSDRTPEHLTSPVSGQIIPIEQVPEQLFTDGSMGKGLAIIPSSDVLHAPCNARVAQIFCTKHALALESHNHAEILLHIGIDTVEMLGHGFESFVENDDEVSKGQPLVKFNLDQIRKAGFSPVIIMMICNPDRFTHISFAPPGHIDAGAYIATLNPNLHPIAQD